MPLFDGELKDTGYDYNLPERSSQRSRKSFEDSLAMFIKL